MRLLYLTIFLLSISFTNADWWDSATDYLSDGLNSAANWVKEKASPTIREKLNNATHVVGDYAEEKFNQAKESLQDPETHKTIREWIADKAEKASEFAQTEVLPELKKIYNAATADETDTTTHSHD